MGLIRLFKNITFLCRYDLKQIKHECRKIFDYTELDNLKFEIADAMQKGGIKLPKIKNRFETLDALLNSQKSLSRLGDGEFMLMNGESIPFQTHSPEIEEKLQTIVRSSNDNIMVGLADFMGTLEAYTAENKHYWRTYLPHNRNLIYKYIDFNKQYYDACVTRPYINYQDKTPTAEYYRKFKTLWKNKNVIIIEGAKTRSGIGNDLYDECKTVKRILAPSLNAYKCYEDILQAALSQPKDSLFLISLGPTASILAYDLALKGRRAIDTGHLDVEYMWFLTGAQKRCKLPGKFVLEAKGGQNVKAVSEADCQNQVIVNLSGE